MPKIPLGATTLNLLSDGYTQRVIDQAFEEVKKWAEAAWEWLAPVRQAFTMVFGTAKRIVIDALVSVQQTAQRIWKGMFGDVKLNWESIRNYILRALFFIEYSMLHFGQVANVTWLGIQYGALKLVNNLINNVFLLLLAFLLGPAGLLLLLVVGFRDAFRDIYWAVVNAVRAMMEVLTNFFRELYAGLASGKFDFNKVFKLDLGKIEFFGGLRGLKIPGLERMMNDAKKEFEEAGGKLGDDFEKFFQQRLKDMGLLDEAEKRAKKGTPEPDPYVQQAVKDSQKLEQVTRSSASAISRYEDYKDKIAVKTAQENAKVKAAGGFFENLGNKVLAKGRAGQLKPFVQALGGVIVKAKVDDVNAATNEEKQKERDLEMIRILGEIEKKPGQVLIIGKAGFLK